MRRFFQRLRRVRPLAAPAVTLAALLPAACADPTPLATSPEEESVVVVRGPGGYHDLVEDESHWATLHRTAAWTDGGKYGCHGIRDCWLKCPEPQLDGGTTVCSCKKVDEGVDEEDPNDDYWECTVKHYGPEENPAGGGDAGEVKVKNPVKRTR